MTELCLSVINIYEIRQNDAASREPCGSGMVNDRYVNRASEALKTQMDSAFERRLSVYSKAPVTVGESATLRIGTDICSFPSPLCVEGCRPRHSRTHVTRKIPIHQVVTKRSLYPRKPLSAGFCALARTIPCVALCGGHWTLQHSISLRQTFYTATYHRYHIATARLVGTTKVGGLPLCCPMSRVSISYLSHQVLV